MSKYGNHQAFLRKVMLDIQTKFPSIRLFPVATGQAYAVFSVKEAISYAAKTKDINGALSKLQRVVYGTKGMSDIIGIFHGIFVAVEIKTNTARQSEEQINFQEMANNSGAAYMVVSNKSPVEDQIQKLYEIEEWAKNVRR